MESNSYESQSEAYILKILLAVFTKFAFSFCYLVMFLVCYKQYYCKR